MEQEFPIGTKVKYQVVGGPYEGYATSTETGTVVGYKTEIIVRSGDRNSPYNPQSLTKIGGRRIRRTRRNRRT